MFQRNFNLSPKIDSMAFETFQEPKHLKTQFFDKINQHFLSSMFNTKQNKKYTIFEHDSKFGNFI